jgi:hypothetical protein
VDGEPENDAVQLTITDIVVIPASDTPHPADDTHESAGDPPVQLTGDLALAKLPHDEAEAYMDACEPAHLNHEPARQFGQRYSFVRTDAPTTERSTYTADLDQLIEKAIQLSRLIVPNSHGTDYALRRVEGFTHPPDQVTLAALRPHARFYAYVPGSDEPTWLDQGQAEALGRLLRAYLRAERSIPKRVKRAMQAAELSSRSPYYQTAYVHVVTGLEALLKTHQHGSTEQFTRRVPLLARELGITGITARRARRFYRARSTSVHGGGMRVTTLAPANRELGAMQRLLQRALRRAIEEPAFRSRFRSAPTVRAAWPVTWRGQGV